MIVLGLLACTAKKPSTVDLDLPEDKATVEARDASTILEEAAGSIQPSQRAIALEALITTHCCGSETSWAQRALYDPDAWVQQIGAAAIAATRSPQANALLSEWIQTDIADPYARTLIAIRLPDETAVRNAWSQTESPWRATPLAYGAALFGDEDALAQLTGAIAAGEIGLEEPFVEALGRCDSLNGPAPVCPAILSALTTGEAWVEEELSLAYAAARLRLGDASAEQLFRSALNDSDPRIQLQALDHLTRIRGPAVDALLRKGKSSSDAAVAAYATLALAARDGTNLSSIATAFEDGDSLTRALAVRFAGERARSQIRKELKVLTPVLEAATRDADVSIREAAYRAASGLPAPRPDWVRVGLTDPSPLNRVLAAAALERTGPWPVPPPPVDPR